MSLLLLNSTLKTTQAISPEAYALYPTRFDGGSDEVLVSGGLILPKGLILSAELDQWGLWTAETGGEEIPCYLSALGRDYADDSVRSLGHQLLLTFTGTASPIYLRKETSLARETPVTFPALPDAKLFGTPAFESAAHGIYGPLHPVTSWAADSANVQVISDVVEDNYADFQTTFARANAYYVPGSKHVAFSMVTGVHAMFNKGIQIIQSWHDDYMDTAGGGAEWYSEPHDLKTGYLLTGNTSYRTTLGHVAGAGVQEHGSDSSTGPWAGNLPLGVGSKDAFAGYRHIVRSFDAMIAAHLCGLDYVRLNSEEVERGAVPILWLEERIAELLEMQQADGSWGVAEATIKCYMQGMVCRMLVNAYTMVGITTGIESAVRNGIQAARDAGWVDASKGFRYTTTSDPHWDDPDTTPAPTLNNFYLLPVLWLANVTSDSAERTELLAFADDLMEGSLTDIVYILGNPADWVRNKMFDEVTQYFPEAIAQRDRVASTGTV